MTSATLHRHCPFTFRLGSSCRRRTRVPCRFERCALGTACSRHGGPCDATAAECSLFPSPTTADEAGSRRSLPIQQIAACVVAGVQLRRSLLTPRVGTCTLRISARVSQEGESSSHTRWTAAGHFIRRCRLCSETIPDLLRLLQRAIASAALLVIPYCSKRYMFTSGKKEKRRSVQEVIRRFAVE